MREAFQNACVVRDATKASLLTMTSFYAIQILSHPEEPRLGRLEGRTRPMQRFPSGGGIGRATHV